MCGFHLFHKWGKYVDGSIVRRSIWTQEVVYRHPAQQRYCERCGKNQVRVVGL